MKTQERPTKDQLYSRQCAVEKELGIGSTWQHYNGMVYTVENTCILNDEVAVLYREVCNPSSPLFCRLYSEWIQQILPDNAPESQELTVPRFIRVKRVTRWEPAGELD